jgi:hypothetical protein
MIRVLTGFPDNVLAVACEGRVTRQDYRDVLLPAIGAMLQRNRKVRVYCAIAPQFAGFEAGAMWEDFRLGIGHWSCWERIAIVTDLGWVRHAANALRLVMPGKARVFRLGEAAAARHWIAAYGGQ